MVKFAVGFVLDFDQGIATIVMTKTYFDLAFKVADMVGQ